MLGNRRLVVDNFSEVVDLLRGMADEFFYDFGMVTPEPNSVYVIGRQQMINYPAKIRDMALSDQYTVVFGNSAEGAWTLEASVETTTHRRLGPGKKITTHSWRRNESRLCIPYS
jgi:6-phosphogluconate dehydrogenase (decarboxylating)